MIKWFGIIILAKCFEFGDRASLWYTVSQSKYRSATSLGKKGMNRHCLYTCCGGMFNGDIIQMCEARVRAMSLIGGNSLKTSLLILMSIVHSSSLLWISCEMMITYRSGTDRVVIVSIWVYGCMWQCTGSRRMGRIPRTMYVGSRGF